MKYSIQETSEKVAPYKLYRYDEYAGVPNNAELEFWMRIQELENALKVADLRLHIICGAYMSIAHGEPEEMVFQSVREMGPDMDTVRKALNFKFPQMPPQDLPRTNPYPSPPQSQELPTSDSKTEF